MKKFSSYCLQCGVGGVSLTVSHIKKDAVNLFSTPVVAMGMHPWFRYGQLTLNMVDFVSMTTNAQV